MYHCIKLKDLKGNYYGTSNLRKLLIAIVCISLYILWNNLVYNAKTTTKRISIDADDPSANYHLKQRPKRIILTESLKNSDNDAATIPPKPTLSFTEELLQSYQDNPTKLMDLNDFQYIINKPACDSSVQALIIIFSAPKNVEKRNTIRRTWGNAELLKGTPLRILYFYGVVTDGKLKKILTAENSKYQDLVQGSFIDHYRNLTYKHTMALKWHATYCHTAQILIKADDDVYVNTPQLIQYAIKKQPKIKSHKKFNASSVLFNQPKNLLFGKTFKNAKPVRVLKSRWYVTEHEYPGEYYPTYCYGQAIVYSTDVVIRLLNATINEKYFWIDDVFMTGMMAKKINLTAVDSREYTLEKNAYQQFNITQSDLSDHEFLFSWHSLEMKYMKEIWKLYMSYIYQKISFNYFKSNS